MTTYAALSQRIRAAETQQELAKREGQITRHYHAGTLNAAELSRLDGKIMDRVFILDTITTIPTITAP
jgi:hypothetical protein